MRFICFLLSLCFLLGVSAPAQANADGAEIPRIMLYTCYRQLGWGDSIQVGCVDERGGVWLLTGNDSDLHWPSSPSEQLSYLTSCGILARQGRLNDADLYDMKSLVSACPDMGSGSWPAANDAGTESSYAVRYDGSGNPMPVLLGMSGDDCFENADANAQALYLGLRSLFPQVTSYAYSYGGMGPQGFMPVPVMSFCGFWGVSLESAAISASSVGSGAGSYPVQLTDDEQAHIRSLVLSGQVTGKANASPVTGNSMVYNFLDDAGNTLASLELYNGLLVRPDGMYFIN